MGVGQRNHMVDIKIASNFDGDSRVGVEPSTACYDAFPGVSEPHRLQGFIYQDFCPCILAVSVGGNPSSPVFTVILLFLTRRSYGKAGDSDGSLARIGSR